MQTAKLMPKRMQQMLLSAVIEFMARKGVSESSIRDSFKKGLLLSRRPEPSGDMKKHGGRYLPNGDVSADVLRLWHRDGRYIDDREAKPRRLYLLKGRSNVRALILEVDNKANVRSVISFMKSAGLIRRGSDGKYVPTTEVGAITQSDHFVVEHVVRSIFRLLCTIYRNAAEPGDMQPLIERYAYVSDLSPAERRAFAEFTKSQGLSYLQAVDDWMEQRRVCRRRNRRSRGEKGVVAGVQVVAYLGDAFESEETI